MTGTQQLGTRRIDVSQTAHKLPQHPPCSYGLEPGQQLDALLYPADRFGHLTSSLCLTSSAKAFRVEPYSNACPALPHKDTGGWLEPGCSSGISHPALHTLIPHVSYRPVLPLSLAILRVTMSPPQSSSFYMNREGPRTGSQVRPHKGGRLVSRFPEDLTVSPAFTINVSAWHLQLNGTMW